MNKDSILIVTLLIPVLSLGSLTLANDNTGNLKTLGHGESTSTAIQTPARNDTLPPLSGDPARCNDLTEPQMHGDHKAALDIVLKSDATHCFWADEADWNDARAWMGGVVPDRHTAARIAAGATAFIDGDFAFRSLRIDGALMARDGVTARGDVETIVCSPTGRVALGSPVDPFNGNLEFSFQNNGDIDVRYDPILSSRGFITMCPTSIIATAKTPYIRLAKDAFKGERTLTLASAADDWSAGDEIFLTGIRLGKHERANDGEPRDVENTSEEFTITDIDGASITLDRKIAKSNFDAHPSHPDRKAFVGNLNRPIRFTMQSGEKTPVHQRFHLMFMHPQTDVRYTEASDCGRTDKRQLNYLPDAITEMTPTSNRPGRYCYHLHKVGVEPGISMIRLGGNVATRSYGWGYTHHQSFADLAWNIGYDIFGACMVSEDGNERGPWRFNLCAKSQGVGGQGFHNSPKDGNAVGTDNLGRNGQLYWNTARHIDMIGNIGADSPGGHCITFFTRGNKAIPNADEFDDPSVVLYGAAVRTKRIDGVPLGEYRDNECHATQIGSYIEKSGNHQGSEHTSVIKDNFFGEIGYVGSMSQYTTRYVFKNNTILGSRERKEGHRRGVINAGSRMTFVENAISGFDECIHDAGPGSSVAAENTYIDNVLIDCGKAYRETEPASIITIEDIPGFDLSFTPERPQFAPLNFNTSLQNPARKLSPYGVALLDGVMTDSLGTLTVGKLPGESMHVYANPRRPEIELAAKRNGCARDKAGKEYAKIERTFTDRITLETLRHIDYVWMPDGWCASQGAEITKLERIR